MKYKKKQAAIEVDATFFISFVQPLKFSVRKSIDYSIIPFQLGENW